jgi:DNA-binding transcriptional MocR family regulator
MGATMGTARVQEEVSGVTSRRDLVKGHVRGLVASGVLRRGSRVPSIVELTRVLDVGKNTVVGALDDLCAEGLLEARERQGFFVRTTAPSGRDAGAKRAMATRLADLRLDAVAHGMATVLGQSSEDFVTIGSGTTAESLLATPEWSGMLRRAPPREPLTGLRYADPLGEPRLREVIASRGGGGEVSPERVVVTLGAIEALNHAFGAAAAATGSRRIGIESPGYFMLGSMIEALGLEVVPIRREAGGLDLDMLRRELRRGPLAAMMVNSNHQNPTGASLSLSERFDLAALAQERRFFVIEDDVYKGLWTHAEEAPSIHSLLPERTLYLSSFSKTLGAALRVGFIVAPEALVEPLRRRKFLSTISGDAYVQNLVAEFVERRGYTRHLVEMREELSRRARIADAQSAPFASLGKFAGQYPGGLFWRFEFRQGIDAMRLYVAARRRNMLISPGSFFRFEASGDATARDAWMRVNVSRCEGTTLERVLSALSEEAGR